MSPQGFPPAYPSPGQTWDRLAIVWPVRLAGQRLWLHLLLLAITCFTTTFVGARLFENFAANRAAFDFSLDLPAYLDLLREPSRLTQGLYFSVTLLTILMAHEMGHYLACVYYRLDASLPYFLPAPTFIGTFGAFIRIRSQILSRRVLFDVGVAGPIAGFVFLLPALGVGLAFSKVIPKIGDEGDLLFGVPLLVQLLENLVFPGIPASDIYLHPVARAAWVGLFATALNLLPFGQLDGGHIVYAFFGSRFRVMSRVFLAMLAALGYWYKPWLLWAGVLLFFGSKHPTIYDPRPLGVGRHLLGWLALLIFLLSFMPVPIATLNL